MRVCVYTYFYIWMNSCRNAVHKSYQILCALKVWDVKDEKLLLWTDDVVDVHTESLE